MPDSRCGAGTRQIRSSALCSSATIAVAPISKRAMPTIVATMPLSRFARGLEHSFHGHRAFLTHYSAQLRDDLSLRRFLPEHHSRHREQEKLIAESQ